MDDKKKIIGVVAGIVILAIVLLVIFLNKPVYEVSFVTNNEVVETINVEKNDVVSEPAVPTRDGYTFDGWYLEDELFDFTTKIKEDITLTAKWTVTVDNTNKRRVTISFNSAGGTDVDAQIIEINTTVKEPIAPERDGYKFIEWQLNSKAFDFNTEITENITLVAKWEEVNVQQNTGTTKPVAKVKYTITFNTNGGSTIKTQTIESGKTVAKPSNPIRDGYTFKGWYYNNVEYNFNTKVTRNIVLTAKWEKNAVIEEVVKYTVVFNTEGGSAVETQTIESGKVATKPSDPIRDGYTFKGWYYNNVEYNFNTIVTNNIVLTAKWEKNDEITYKIEETLSTLGQVKIFVLKNGEKVDGIVDITTLKGTAKDVNIPKEGYTTNSNNIVSIDNVRVK